VTCAISWARMPASSSSLRVCFSSPRRDEHESARGRERVQLVRLEHREAVALVRLAHEVHALRHVLADQRDVVRQRIRGTHGITRFDQHLRGDCATDVVLLGRQQVVVVRDRARERVADLGVPLVTGHRGREIAGALQQAAAPASVTAATGDDQRHGRDRTRTEQQGARVHQFCPPCLRNDRIASSVVDFASIWSTRA
jgi:hypothetical protein